MAGLSIDQKQGLGVALNEATFVDAHLEPDGSRIALRLEVLSWDPWTDKPIRPTVDLVLTPVGRIVASLRFSVWNDKDAAVRPISLGALEETIRQLGPSPIYGWEFIDVERDDWAFWEARASLDREFSNIGLAHHIHLFKESHSPNRILDLRIWFDELGVADLVGQPIELDDFIARGVRWWDAMYAGDPRTSQAGIVAFSPTPPEGDANPTQ